MFEWIAFISLNLFVRVTVTVISLKMNFTKIFFFIFACIVLTTVSGAPSPKWKLFKRIEKIGRNVRNGLIKAGPAIQVVGQATAIAKG
ncbi:cecropin-A-like [Nymphalis io]|uniref:cecropin-A-like n=1 Tax=Inachis io TaxID=171585 RepID=UPI002169DE45|nr:cecropin-A-like [Nymphalis io]